MSEAIRIACAHLSPLAIDAIVNAVDPSTSGGAHESVDRAIHAGAGPRMAEACACFAPRPVGRARITQGPDPPEKSVIHICGPVWNGGGRGEEDDLASCNVSALSRTSISDAGVVAIPAISTGTFGFPVDRAAGIAVSQVLLVCRSTGTEAALRAAVASDRDPVDMRSGQLRHKSSAD